MSKFKYTIQSTVLEMLNMGPWDTNINLMEATPGQLTSIYSEGNDELYTTIQELKEHYVGDLYLLWNSDTGEFRLATGDNTNEAVGMLAVTYALLQGEYNTIKGILFIMSIMAQALASGRLYPDLTSVEQDWYDTWTGWIGTPTYPDVLAGRKPSKFGVYVGATSDNWPSRTISPIQGWEINCGIFNDAMSSGDYRHLTWNRHCKGEISDIVPYHGFRFHFVIDPFHDGGMQFLWEYAKLLNIHTH